MLAPPSPSLPVGTWTATLLAVAAVSLLPLLVTFILAHQEAQLRRWLPQLTVFGAGTVLAAGVGHLIPESLQNGLPPWIVAGGVVAGYLVFAAIERALAGHDHAHAHGIPLGAPSAHDSDRSEADCVHLHPTPLGNTAVPSARTLAPMAFVGDAIHNFMDGALIAAAFMADPTVGILTLVAVGLHELPRELGTFGLFVHGGIRPMRAVVYNLVTAGVAFLGAALTLLVGSRMASMTIWLLPFAAGTYVYIAQVVGRSALRDSHDSPPRWGRLAWGMVGAALVLVVALVETA